MSPSSALKRSDVTAPTRDSDADLCSSNAPILSLTPWRTMTEERMVHFND
jgi:hypothetical protein